ncbi:MAG TPA: diguanylate cyclase [Xanthomonadaceae bacterium]|nr:diguanylate cyclase [Xanthomonadaceae bacterium]
MSLRQREAPASPTPPPRQATEPVAALERLVLADQVRSLYRQALPAMVISIAVAALLCAMLWEVTLHRTLALWLAAVVAISGWRIGLVWRFYRHAPQGERAADWEAPFVRSLVAAALVWGLGALAVLPPQSPTHQAVVYFFLMGMAGGSTAMYTSHRFGVAAAVLALMLPATVWMAAQGTLITFGMAFGGVLFLITALRSTRLFAYFLRRSFELSHELALAHAAAERLAFTDPLTGLANRRALFEHGAALAARADRAGAAIMLDLDHFKQINDLRGHQAGDETLRAIGTLLRERTDADGVVGRLGGEEFAILLPGFELERAAALAESLRAAIAATAIGGDGGFHVTASFGVASLEHGLEAGLLAADKALYRAKNTGRDRVMLAA